MMDVSRNEDAGLRSVTLQNAQSILQARLRAEEELRKQSEWLRVTLASIGDAVISTDAEGRVNFMNGVAESLTGWALADALGRHLEEVFQIVNETSRQPVENPAMKALRDGAIVALANHTVLIARDKTERPIGDSAAPIRSREGQIVGSVLVFRDVSESHRTQKILRESEQRFRFMADAAPVLIWVSDTAKSATWFNKRWLDFVGRTMEQETGQGWTQNLHPDDREQYLTNYAAAFDARKTFRMEYRMKHRDGHYRWLLDNGVPRYEQDGQFAGYIGSCVDITDQKIAMLTVRNRESQLQLVADHAPVLIAHCGTDLQYKFVNKNYASRFGLTPQDIIGRTIPEVVGAAAYVAFERYVARALAGEAVEFETEIPYEVGGPQFMHASYVPERDVDGRVVGFVAAIANVTERKKSEEASGRLAAIIESSEDAIISKRLDGIITSWNKSAEKMFGYQASEAVGRHISLIIPLERRSEEDEVIARLRGGESIEHFETVRQAKDGRRLNISLSVSPVRDSAGRVTGAAKVARDITERMQAEAERERLLASERSARADAERGGRLKDEFLATLSHELRTPLSAILGWSHILRKQTPTPELLNQGLGVIDRNARMQTQLIADLLDMSRIISGKMRMDVQRVELTVVMEAALESIRPAAEAKEVRLQSVLEPISDSVHGDPARIQQIIWNLVSNAVKFTPRGGRVQVVLARVNSHVEITVSDTGKGIKPEFLPHVFERFRQADSSAAREHGGLGLGLAIVKQLVELHGGAVQVTSAGEGKGSTFTVHLPLAALQASSSIDNARVHPRDAYVMPAMHDGPNLAGIRVLVVDDEPDARDLVRRVLEECNAEVVQAGSADEGLEAIKRERLDVIISDIGMPDSDGLAFIHAVRKCGIRIPAAALTAFARSEDRTRALRAGYQTHLAKPVEPSELLAMVAALVHKSGTMDGNKQA
ncbi:MAG: PAS domain S-box protein [Pyrinomonadaceae bacterium]|nr:PAS domain S-box protein [Phycisphaerales bacterium]